MNTVILYTGVTVYTIMLWLLQFNTVMLRMLQWSTMIRKLQCSTVMLRLLQLIALCYGCYNVVP